MKHSFLGSVLLCALSTTTMASPVTIVGTLPVSIDSHSRHARSLQMTPPKVISLQKLHFSKEAKQHLVKQIHHELNQKKQPKLASATLPSNYLVGMNNTPVLDQGMHGSCVTFANAGAIDAVLAKGDYVSELCSLSLGSYLEKEDSSHYSGWDGSWGPIVLKQMFTYGIVSMDNQHHIGCAGVTEYPRNDASTGNAMSTDDYKYLSESIRNTVQWRPILSSDDAFSPRYASDYVLNRVKQTLAQDQRLTFGVGLDVRLGSAGAVGSYKAYHDTWMLTAEIEYDANNDLIEAGHEMIIIGYDDDVVVTTLDGTENKGLLILRNSWGVHAGDRGNFYMSYAHFKALTDEVQIVKENTH